MFPAAAKRPGRPASGSVAGSTAAPVPVRHIARDRAASLLEMPEAKLCQVNHHINQAYTPAQTTLIVWRYRIQPYGSTQ